jgi:hypothetical protein
MEILTTIPKERKLSPDQDFQWLRKEGLNYIESLGSDLWTDYNVHDPGITILEALCYAITELGYRADFPIKDLLTEADGKIGNTQAFYTAKNILTCNALTINDYRKLLVDIVGIHNAWLYAGDMIKQAGGKETPVNEVPLFADCKNDELTAKKTDHPLYLSGLYRVLLDLDNDDQFGDLNKGDIEIFNPVSSGATPKFKAGDISFTIELPYWNEVPADFVAAASKEEHITNIEIAQEDAKWKCTVTTDTGLPSLTFTITINLKPKDRKIELADLQDFFSPKYTARIFAQYLLKIEKIKSILLLAKKTLHESRNLCEDFLKIETVQDEEVAICCDIDVRPDTDMEQVQAQVFYLIENYLNPSVNFYLLKELISKGIAVDEIFQGPKLNHGFIDTKELEGTNLREVIYTSDIINLLMDVPGVLSVRNFMLTKYDKNGDVIKGQSGLKWCMHIAPQHKPVLSINRSKIIFYKNNFPFLATYAEIRDTLKLLRAGKERPKLKGQQDDLLLPSGQYHVLEDYYSIQNDFPQTYGISAPGLPLSATPLRKAQAKQLKAYLLFFDQVLADFFSQLSNAKRLLSLEDIRQTYFSQFLETIPHIDPVYKKDAADNAILKTVYTGQDSTVASTNKAWKKLVEDEIKFEERRNLFLDHLLARFAEGFNEYVLMMYTINYKDRTAASLTSEKLIQNKIGFLKEYPVISYERGKGFNYFPLDENDKIDEIKLWDTDNVSGLEKRTSKLAGIKNYYRRFLSCIKDIDITAIQETVVENGMELVKTYYTFTVKNKNGDVLLPNEKFESSGEIAKVVAELVNLLNDKANYLYDATSKKIEVINSASKVVAVSSTTYNTKADADKIIRQFEKEFSEDCPDAEGMMLIEHILLRPRKDDFNLMTVCLDKDCEFCGEEDPYSFRASVFLPYWPEAFSMNFRNYFEQMIRTESPAHVMLKVCWLNNAQMRDLEITYKSWISALAEHSFDPTDENKLLQFKSANDALVKLLRTLHTVYPEATLHDCDASEDPNPVMLGKTILGTIKHTHHE